MTERQSEIDTLRGLACLLLVAYHVVGASADSGLLLADGWLRNTNDYLAYLRMPLFTVLSGYVYAMRPFSGQTLAFLRGKARRLLIPMLFVGTIFAITQNLAPGANAEVEKWYLLHIVPVAHFWFVESLFIIFLLIVPLERSSLLSSMLSFLIVFAISVVFYLFFPITKLFSISGATYLLPYFLFGLLCGRFKVINFVPRAWAGLMACGALGALVLFGHYQYSTRSVFAIGVGILACAALLTSRINVGVLARIGVYSYTIYLLHVFFTAGSRIFLNRAGVDAVYVLFVIGSAAGILGPIVLEVVFGRFPWFKLLVSGQSYKTKRKLSVGSSSTQAP
jgi:fucose 4-O-acetylase-like acetyltransferase